MRISLSLIVFSAGLLAGSPAIAQSWPSRQVTIVATSAPGAATDVLARAIGQRLSEKWNQPVVVENRPGAAYAIAAAAVAKANPDAYTLIATELGMFTSQQYLHQQDKRPFDGERDFVPVSGFAEMPVALVAHPAFGVKSVAELIAQAKGRPGLITYGTAGPGTAPHLATLLLESMAGVKLSAVHYRGIAPALNDVVAGHITLITMGPAIAIANYKAGKLALLGVGGAKPLPQLPEIPTIAATVPGYEATVGFGLAAPVATPRDVVAKINADVQDIIRDPAFRAKVLDTNVLQPILGTPQEFAAYLSAESRKWQRVIKDANIKLD
jgi:tripartite-type tricarboxylate transporter receptor subunit TctC